MRIAVLGVGLIGGSIGMGARARLEAEVVGFDPDAAILDRAQALGAIDEGSSTVAAAVRNAEIVFCAAPVRALPALVAAALAASGDDTVVTDVGSSKRTLVAGLGREPGSERFIGGHPLAGAETAGVQNARADLFDGARWYLTPTEQAGGMHYDRLQRAVADLGARPQAVHADLHDRLMATVSHLPHVIANVLVGQARTALSEETERLPEVGPSFRDTTRVAGANPAIWGDIFAANAEAVAGEIDAVVARLEAAAELIRGGDAEAVAAWHHDALDARRELLEADVAGGELSISVDEINLDGEMIELGDLMGVPVIEVRIADQNWRMFFDTGAKISYFQDESLTTFPLTGELNDFFPGFGQFQTNTHLVDFEIGASKYSFQCGSLPGLLGMTLSLAGSNGIVGNELIRNRIAGYFPRRKMMILG